MKMTAEDIVKVYKNNPTKETMEQLALANDCTIADIGHYLKEEATKKEAKTSFTEEKKKPGRPKGSANKEKTVKPKELPEYVRATLEARLQSLNENRQILLNSLERVNKEAEELTSFLYE